MIFCRKLSQEGLNLKKLTKNEEIILELVSTLMSTNIGELEEKTSISKRTIQRALKVLVEQGLIEAVGTTSDRYYKRVYSVEDSALKLVVFSSGSMVGELHYGNGEYIFVYDDSYKGSKLEGLNRENINRSVELFPYFENLIPEYDRRDRLLHGKDDIAEVLEGLKNSHGALTLFPNINSLSTSLTTEVDKTGLVQNKQSFQKTIFQI